MSIGVLLFLSGVGLEKTELGTRRTRRVASRGHDQKRAAASF